ncbi:hypothetical protein RUM43_009776 [Polyplax serrata]|uniref:Uncharacterized protein n=1 Tax=Polyplax serrata TaxID=468196 RepID=A0AAN8P2S8_POLSC
MEKSLQVEGFEMQVYVLRQLLNAEKNRVESVTRNIQDLMQKIENSDREKTQMAEANNELKISLKNQMIFCSHLENTLRNKENEIMNYRVEVEDWEKQMANKREKLKAIETTSMVLKKKAQAAEEVAAMKGMQLEKLSAVQMELQSKLSSLEAVNMKLKVTEMAKNDLEKVVETRNLEVKQLRCIINTLQNSLQEEDEKNGILNKTILEKTNELSLVEQKLVDLTKSNYPWSGGAFRMASLCAKIPVACICTVGSLLLPFPSYRI